VDLYLRARLQYLRNYFSDATTASELFAKALERAPDDPRIIAGYAMARARTTFDDAARRALKTQAERAVRLAPSLPEVHLALGAVLFQALDDTGATRSFHRALRLNSNSAEAHDFLGRALYECDGAEAPRHLEVAIALEPTLVLPRAALARYHAMRGDWTEVDELLSPTAEIDARMLVPHRARLLVWRRDARTAEELLSTFTPDAIPLRSARTSLLVAMGKDVAADELYVPPPQAGARLRCFYAQMRAEVRAHQGNVARTLEEIETAGALNLYDISWLERCPLLELVKAEPRYRAVRDVVAERAATVRAAYAEPDA
jgi:serine/threonine-protein kinase